MKTYRQPAPGETTYIQPHDANEVALVTEAGDLLATAAVALELYTLAVEATGAEPWGIATRIDVKEPTT